MVRTLYHLGIQGYNLLLRVASPFHKKAKLMVEGRQNWRHLMARYYEKDKRPVAWFHAASLGEFEQGRPVMELFRQQHPEYSILLTFFSPSGYEVRKNYSGADYIGYLPADTAKNAADFIAITRPKIAFFIKYEFWYNYASLLQQQNIPLISFSAIFRSNQVFFKPYGGFYRSILRCFSKILVQNQESVDLLTSIGLATTTYKSGDTRFDRVSELPLTARSLPEVDRFVQAKTCLVVGSAWQEDMDVLFPVLNKFGNSLKVIIAPHEIDDATIEQWRGRLKQRSIRYSTLSQEVDYEQATYLFIDNIGMLSALYRYGTFALIGGGFKTGLHNILEAATYGIPVFFGNKKYKKFQEAVSLAALGAAHPLEGSEQLDNLLHLLIHDPDELARQGAISKAFILEHKGATEQVMQVANDLLTS